MKAPLLPLICTFGSALALAAQTDLQRVFVLTDISNEPDDEQSMVRFLVYANEYDIEGLVATTSTWLRSTTRIDLIHRQLDAYAQVRPNLMKHAPGFPSAESLRAVTATGQTTYGMGAVGDGKSTAGSKLLLAAASKPDPRPLWVTVWGGANTLAQALFDARRDRTPTELDTLVAKLRVYTISDQDDAGPWMRREFPGLFYIVSPSTTDWKEYWRATWTGIAGDRHYRNAPGHKFHMVDNPWLEEHIIKNHGPLGALYPRLEYIMEGDTPSFLGLIQNGLGWHVSPAYGVGLAATCCIRPTARPVPSGPTTMTAATPSPRKTGRPSPAIRPQSGAGASISRTTLPLAWTGAWPPSTSRPITIPLQS
jgi:hypothetical protein